MSETFEFKEAGLPNIYGSLYVFGGTANNTGAFRWNAFGGLVDGTQSVGALTDGHGDFDASRCSVIYGNSTTVQPASYTVLFIMKIKK